MSSYQQGRQQGQGGNARLADYRSVADRIDEFWKEMRGSKIPARIVSEIIKETDKSIAFCSEVWVHIDGAWVMLANGYAEDMRSSAPNGKCMEVAETSAIGRALANAGYTASRERASRDEMESYYAAQEAEARERGTLAAPDATGEEPTPIATTEARTTRKRSQRATEPPSAAAVEPEKVGIVSAQGETRGATVEAAQRKQEALPATPDEPNIGFDTMIDPDVAPVATASQPTADPLANYSPGFRKFIEKGFEAVDNGLDFDTIKAKFSAAKGKLTDEQVKEAQRQLASIRKLCKERDEAIASRTAELATAVATELDELTDEELAFMKAS